MNSLQKFAALSKVASMKKAAIAVFLIKRAEEAAEKKKEEAPSTGKKGDSKGSRDRWNGRLLEMEGMPEWMTGKNLAIGGGGVAVGAAGAGLASLLGRKKKKRPTDEELAAMLKEESKH